MLLTYDWLVENDLIKMSQYVIIYNKCPCNTCTIDMWISLHFFKEELQNTWLMCMVHCTLAALGTYVFMIHISFSSQARPINIYRLVPKYCYVYVSSCNVIILNTHGVTHIKISTPSHVYVYVYIYIYIYTRGQTRPSLCLHGLTFNSSMNK